MQNDFYNQLGYDGILVNISEIGSKYPDYEDILKIGADKVYFSGNHPAIIFVDVENFDNKALLHISKIQHNAWNYRKIILLFAISNTEIRIYNCYGKPLHIGIDDNADEKLRHIEILQYSEKSNEPEQLKVLLTIFSKIGIDSGLIWSDHSLRQKLNIQNRIDTYLVKCLCNTANELEKDNLDKKIIHSFYCVHYSFYFWKIKAQLMRQGYIVT